MVQAATVALGCALAFCAPKTSMGQGVEVFEEVGMMPFRGCHSSTSQQCISTAGSNSTAPRVCTFRVLRAATITPRGQSPHRPTITIDNTSLLNVSGTFTVQPGQLVEWTSDRRLDDFFLCANGVQPQLSCASTYVPQLYSLFFFVSRVQACRCKVEMTILHKQVLAADLLPTTQGPR